MRPSVQLTIAQGAIACPHEGQFTLLRVLRLKLLECLQDTSSVHLVFTVEATSTQQGVRVNHLVNQLPYDIFNFSQNEPLE